MNNHIAIAVVIKYYCLFLIVMMTIAVNHSCPVQLMEEYGVSGAAEESSISNGISNQLSSVVLLIQKNVELDTRGQQLGLQLASSQAELQQEHIRRSDLADDLIKCKQVSKLVS
jgi:hypothetical protein